MGWLLSPFIWMTCEREQSGHSRENCLRSPSTVSSRKLAAMKTLRTPDERFTDLPEFPFEPHYTELADGEGGSLRVHYLDEGPRDAPPVLLMHGEADLRCPIAGSEAYYTALTYRGAEVEFARFPGGSHAFPSTAHPALRVDYARRAVEWFRRHLGRQPRRSRNHSPPRLQGRPCLDRDGGR